MTHLNTFHAKILAHVKKYQQSAVRRLPQAMITEVYVALFPDMGATYSFTLTSGGNTYTGTATATLKEGEFVPATGLKLVKQ